MAKEAAHAEAQWSVKLSFSVSPVGLFSASQDRHPPPRGVPMGSKLPRLCLPLALGAPFVISGVTLFLLGGGATMSLTSCLGPCFLDAGIAPAKASAIDTSCQLDIFESGASHSKATKSLDL